jgi:hypothetical protein
MQSFSPYALPATILASALGAIVLCLVLLLYGFPRDSEDESPSRARRLFVIRLGHAVAAACFAAAAILGGVAWFDQRSVIVPPPPTTSQLRAEAASLEAEVEALEERLAVAESRLDDARRDLALIESGVGSQTPSDGMSMPAVASRSPRPASRPAAATSARRETRAGRAARDGGDAMASPPAASGREPGEFAPGGPATTNGPLARQPTSPSQDLGAKLRGDWQVVKRGFRDAGEEFVSHLSDFGRRVKETFASGD